MTDLLANTARALLHGGPIALSLSERFDSWIDPKIDDVLMEVDTIERAEAPGDAPAFDVDAARWATGRLAHMISRIVDREDPADLVERELAEQRVESEPDRRNPSHIWSTDLALRHLASVERLSRGLRSDDPVRREVERLARDWPISGSLVSAATPELPDGIEEHPTLRRLLLDRVTRVRSASYASVPWVHAALVRELGSDVPWLGAATRPTSPSPTA